MLRHPLITAAWPDERALPGSAGSPRRLRSDLADAFGYRLELHGDTAPVLRAKDRLDPGRPAVPAPAGRSTGSGTPTCAWPGRARPGGIQITLSELADAVAADANRITGLGLDPDAVQTGGRSSTPSPGWRSAARSARRRLRHVLGGRPGAGGPVRHRPGLFALLRLARHAPVGVVA